MFPKMAALNLVAPELLMATMMATEISLVSSTMVPVRSDSNIAVVPNCTYVGCLENLGVLFLPGGQKGTAAALQDDTLLNFLANRGGKTRYVTRVCTGSVILGAAGLLKGYHAASHWGTRDMLSMFGATPVAERVVIDRDWLTGGGLTAGLDFGLHLSGVLRGEENVRLQELILEYDPKLPFNSVSLDIARPDTIELARKVLARDMEGIRSAATKRRRVVVARMCWSRHFMVHSTSRRRAIAGWTYPRCGG